MDVPISPALRQRKKKRRWLIGIGAGLAFVLVTIGLVRLQPAAPLVEKSGILLDTVKRGELLREVRGSGTLVPEDIRWIPTVNQGRVEQILVWPGATVRADTVLVVLSNPEVEQEAFDAEWQLKGAEAELANLRVQLNKEHLTQEAAVAAAQAGYTSGKLDLEVNELLATNGLVAAVTLKQSRTKVDQLTRLLEIEQESLKINADAAEAQLHVQEAKVEQLRAQSDLKHRHVEGLRIRAGMDGVLQRLGDADKPLQIGQQLSPGVPVARVANPAKLKAQIKVAETQARDIQPDQLVEVDTRNGIVSGHVIRIDPAVENGTVNVDVALDAELPRGARPDLSVDGTIELERLKDVLYVSRPVQGQASSTVGLFKVIDNGRAAVRVPVKLGRSSVSAIEIVDGLASGDQIIVSDMSQWDAHDRVRLD